MIIESQDRLKEIILDNPPAFLVKIPMNPSGPGPFSDGTDLIVPNSSCSVNGISKSSRLKGEYPNAAQFSLRDLAEFVPTALVKNSVATLILSC